MALIIGSLMLGLALGALDIIPAAWYRHLDRNITIILFIMLIALGAQIGSNAELLNNFVLGWRAFVISALSVIGSIIVLWLAVKYFKLQEGEG